MSGPEIQYETEAGVVVAVFTADWHVARRTWRHRDIEKDTYNGVEQAADAASALGVPLVGAGDLFDSARPSPEDVLFVGLMVQALSGFGEKHGRVYYIEGQHERTGRGRWMEAASRGDAIWLGRSEYGECLGELGDVRVIGVDWSPGAETLLNAPLRDAAQDPRTVIVCHQAWREFMGEGRGEASLADVPGTCPIVTGDFHGHVPSGRHSRLGGRDVISPGSLSMLSIDEPEDKWIWVCRLSHGGDALAWEPWPVKVRPVFRASAVDASEAPEVVEAFVAWEREHRDRWREELASDVRVPLCDVRLVDRGWAAVLARAFAQVQEESPHHLFIRRPSLSEAPPGAASVGLSAIDGPPEGRALRVLDQAMASMGAESGIDQDGLRRILTAPDPDAAVAELRRERESAHEVDFEPGS